MTGKPRLLEQVWEVLGLHHYSIHTEWSYCAWIRQQEIHAVQARRKEHVPVVLQRAEVAHVTALMEGTPQLVA
jgi:hypothetical protein